MLNCSARFRYRQMEPLVILSIEVLPVIFLFAMNLGQSNSVHQLTVVSSLILKLKRNAKHDKLLLLLPLLPSLATSEQNKIRNFLPGTLLRVNVN